MVDTKLLNNLLFYKKIKNTIGGKDIWNQNLSYKWVIRSKYFCVKQEWSSKLNLNIHSEHYKFESLQITITIGHSKVIKFMHRWKSMLNPEIPSTKVLSSVLF